MLKECMLYENKICNNCGECLVCDLDPGKTCDNCGKCIDGGAGNEFRSIVYKADEIEDTGVDNEPDSDIDKSDPEQALINAFLDLPIDLELPEPIEVDPKLAAEWESILAYEAMKENTQNADIEFREIGIKGVRKRRVKP